MKKLLKRLTIRQRAYKFGVHIRGNFGFFFDTESKEFKNTCRTLIRLQRIRCGMKPFVYSTGRMKDVYVFDAALKGFGNIRTAGD